MQSLAKPGSATTTRHPRVLLSGIQGLEGVSYQQIRLQHAITLEDNSNPKPYIHLNPSIHRDNTTKSNKPAITFLQVSNHQYNPLKKRNNNMYKPYIQMI
ncbi:MAG: hypothetical protein L3J49_14240, partial [Desulfobulbaceae bacterium]|nr:hypothetical protein [Desulfobulbaceae bacterium]